MEKNGSPEPIRTYVDPETKKPRPDRRQGVSLASGSRLESVLELLVEKLAQQRNGNGGWGGTLSVGTIAAVFAAIVTVGSITYFQTNPLDRRIDSVVENVKDNQQEDRRRLNELEKQMAEKASWTVFRDAISALRTDMTAAIAALRADVYPAMASLRVDMNVGFTDLRVALKEVSDRLAVVEKEGTNLARAATKDADLNRRLIEELAKSMRELERELTRSIRALEQSLAGPTRNQQSKMNTGGLLLGERTR